MSEVHASFVVDLETKKYADGLARIQHLTKGTASRMVADMAATQKATDALSSGVDKAGRSLNRMGQASMQIQDVAVQLQSGTKFATVLAQQGSQMASIFGPGGAILGGAIAIGSAIYTWASGAKEAEKAFEAAEKRMESMQKASIQLREGAVTATGNARVSSARTTFHKEMAREEIEHQKQLYEIRQRGLISGDAAMQRIAEAAEMERHSVEKTAISRRATLDAVNARTEKEQEIEQQRIRARDADMERARVRLTDAQKIKVVEKEIDAIKNRTTRSDTHRDRLQEATARASLAEKELELEKLKKSVQDEHARVGRKILEDSIETAEKVADTRKELSSLQTQLGQAQAIRAIENRASSGQVILDRAQEFLTPQAQRISRREEQQREERATNRAINEDVDRRDRRSRRLGFGGLSQEEKAQIREERRGEVEAAKHKDKLVAEISDDNIDKLSKKIAEYQEKLIAK